MTKPKILVFAGSARTDSLNKKLASACASLAETQGAEVTLADLADYPAAVYSGDDEDATGLPETMQKFKSLMQSHDGFIVSSPEYNGHVPPLLSNTFSWISRKEGNETGMVAFERKKAAVMAASPGQLGGVRVIPRLRDTLAELGVMVVPGFVTLPAAAGAFNEDGSLTDEKVENNVLQLTSKLIDTCR